GTVGNSRGYLSPDQCDVYTDYILEDPIFLYSSVVMAMPHPGVVPGLTITQIGEGTVLVNGTTFTEKDNGLTPLEAGARVLVLLKHVDGKYFISGRWKGACGIVGDSVTPIASREDFCQEFRGLSVSKAADSISATLRALGK